MKMMMKAKTNTSAALTTVEVGPTVSFSPSKPQTDLRSVHETQDLRASLLSQILREQPFLLKLQQKFRNPFLDFYFWLCSELGEEIFFILLIPGVCWLYSLRLTIHLSVLLVLSVGGGNFLKNYFHLPRPAPPVWTRARLEDHGFPSTHTMSALAFSSYLFYYFFVEQDSSSILHPAVGLMIAAFWFLSVSFSRLYNGYHSPTDVIGGIVVMVLLLVFFFNIRDLVEVLCSTDHVFVPMTTFTLGLFTLYLHPRPPTVNPVVTESALVIGVGFGTICAAWLNSKYDLPSSVMFNNSSEYLPSQLYYYPALTKGIIGSLTLVIVKAIGKPVFKKLNTSLIIPYKNTLCPDVGKKPWSLTDTELRDILTKYLTYFCVSLTTINLLPIVFLNLQLVNPEDLHMFIIET